MMTKRNKRTLIRSAAIAALAATAPAWALNFTWDTTSTGPGDVTITPGSGTWDFVAGNTVWNNAGANVPWTNSNTAIFAGGVDAAAGTYLVTVGTSGLTVSAITIQNSGYTFVAPTPVTVSLPSANPLFSIAAGKVVTVGAGVTFAGGTSAFEITGLSSTSTMNLEAGGTIAGTAFARLNNGILNINGGVVSTGNSSNFALGATTGTNTAVVNLNSGTISSGPNSGSGVRFGSAGGTNTVFLNVNGGVLAVNSFTTTGSPVATLNLNGGIVQARSSNATYFVSGVATTNVQAGGAIIDTAGFNITIGQAITHDPALGVTLDGGLVKLSTGTLTFTGANTYTGGTTIAAGNITADMSTNTSGVLPTGTNLVLGGTTAGLPSGASFTVLGKSTGSSTQTIGSLTLAASTANQITVNPNNGTGTSLTIGNSWTRGAASALVIDLSSTNTGTRNIVSAPTLQNDILGYAILRDTSFYGFATTVSGGNLGRYTAGTALAVGSDSATTNFITATGVTHNAGNWSANSLEFNNTSSIAVNLGGGTVTLTSGAVLFSRNGGTLTLSNGQIGATNSEVIIHNFNNAGASTTMTISGTVSGGTGSLVKTGGSASTLVLSGTNSYTGNTVILGGILQVGGGTSTGSISASSLILNNANLAISRSDDVTFSNTVTGSGTLTKLGSGATTITGSNTYLGQTFVSAGTAVVSTINSVVGGTASSALGAPVTSANGTIQMAGTANAELRYVGNGETTDRLLNVSGAASRSSTVSSSGLGTLTFSSTATLAYNGTGTGSVSTLVLGGTNTGSNTFNFAIVDPNNGSGGVNVVKSGAGKWVLTNAANTYKRATAISDGTLVAAGDSINVLTPDQTAIRRGEATTPDATTDTFALAGGYLNLQNGDKIVMGSGTAPTGTTNGNTYFVINKNTGAGTFQISSSSGGSAVNITDVGGSVGFYQTGIFGSATSAISLGDANTTASGTPTLLLGNAGIGYTTNHAITTSTLASGSATFSIGGNSDAVNTFSGLVTANQNLRVTQVTTTGVNALAITGGITGPATGSKTVTFAGPGAINVSNTGLSDGGGTLAVAVSGGKLTLQTASTYTGGTSVAAGSLYVNNTTGSGTGSGAVGVANGATLGGSGTISGALTVAGTLTPGNSPGRLTIANDVTLTNTATFVAEVVGQSAGVTYDQLTVDGTHVIDLGGATLSVTMGTFGVAEGDRIYLLDNTGTGAITGTFAGLTEGSQVTALDGVNGFNWNITYVATYGPPETNDVALYATSPVPEPAGLGIVALGGFAILMRRRRSHPAR